MKLFEILREKISIDGALIERKYSDEILARTLAEAAVVSSRRIQREKTENEIGHGEIILALIYYYYKNIERNNQEIIFDKKKCIIMYNGKLMSGTKGPVFKISSLPRELILILESYVDIIKQ